MTPKHLMDELPDKNVLFGATWEGQEPHLNDHMGNKYVNLNWEEIMNLIYKGVNCFIDLSPRATTRSKETAYFSETVDLPPTFEGRKHSVHER